MREREIQEREVRFTHDRMSNAEWVTKKHANRHMDEEEDEDSEVLQVPEAEAPAHKYIEHLPQ